MKKIYLPLLILLGSIFAKAQIVQLNENFTAPFNFASAGWLIQNNSSPLGTTTWQGGSAATFPAYNGASGDYVCADKNSQGATPGAISNYLITPTLTIVNGGVIKFATRTVGPVLKPDRMQVFFTLGNGSISTSTSSIGTYTMLGDINFALTSGGFPTTWTLYSYTISTVPTATNGRFAFRYYVNNGGPNGTYSNYIGLDNVTYTVPIACAPPAININPSVTDICSVGGSAMLTASGASNYTWSTGSNATSINVSPTSTTIYTLTGSNIPGCVSTKTILINVVNPPTIAASNATICVGGSTVLTASGASSYTWSNNSNNASINVSPSSTTVYTVSGSGPIVPSCIGTKTVLVNVVTSPPITVSNATVCSPTSVVLTASGASTYTWSTSSNSNSITVSPSSTTNYTVFGTLGTCSGSAIASVIFTTSPNVSVSNVTACPNTNVNITASGASTYTWSNGGSGSSINFSSPVSTTLSVTGFNGPSCASTKTLAVNISTFLVVPSVTACPNTAVTIGASGANTYNWSTSATTPSIIVTPSIATTVYTLTGNNGFCTEVKTVSVSLFPFVTVPNVTTCAGTSATLIASGATTYSWSNGALAPLIVVPSTNSVYTVVGTGGSCSHTRTVSVTIGTKLSINAAAGQCVGASIILTASGANTYTWYPSGGNSSSAVLTPTAAGIYTVAGASGTCAGTQTVYVDYCAGVEEFKAITQAQTIIYPNPFTNQIIVETDLGGNTPIMIFNSLGQCVYSAQLDAEKTTIDLSEHPAGIYFVRIGNITKRVIKR